jgi:hypothetical protein
LKTTIHPLRAFAPLREPLEASRRAGRSDWSHAKAQRREEYHAFTSSFSPFRQGARIYRFSVNFLSFLGFFERGVWLENDALLAAP